MFIYVPKETFPGEKRVALVPSAVKKFIKMDWKVFIQSQAGEASGFLDEDYRLEGAEIVTAIPDQFDLFLSVRSPEIQIVSKLPKNTLLISFLDPFNQKNLLEALAKRSVSAISMEMIPRITRAQKMDALSSQASLAGYVVTLLAATHLPRIFPMMMTPSGTIPPAKVFVIGVGVAGLQIIATAKRLGARVEAFDTRPVVGEQVRSLGAKFVEIDLGETGQTNQGYAKQLTPEQITLQKEGMKKVISNSDVVITTAQVFGRKAPQIVSEEMVKSMKAGSVLVDMAVESGGNIECSELGKVVDIEGKKVVGFGNIPSHVSADASTMYANNLVALLLEFTQKDTNVFQLRVEDEILERALVVHEDQITFKG